MELEDLKFTKELKENWLNALKSGKYKQVSGRLKKIQGHCCLGVLSEIHPDLSIDVNGGECVFNNKNQSYKPFNQILTVKVVRELYRKNDDSYRSGVKDYSAVIPLIEKIPTVD